VTAPLLSVCIATRNRATWLPTTLDNVLAQCTPEVEVVVVDGASTDATATVVTARAAQHANLRYLPQAVNSGIDGDFDKAVALAKGTYCWLFADDDLLAPGALARVLGVCRAEPDVVVVDAEVRSADLSQVLARRRLPFAGERFYGAGEHARLFADCIQHLSFIGAVIVRREVWLARERSAYFGSEFIHVGVLFQQPLSGHAVVLGAPLVQIRYGVGNWLQRSFEVWMVKWPRLLWSFAWLPEAVRAAASKPKPWRDLNAMLGYRAKGWYTRADYLRFIQPTATSALDRIAGVIAWIPHALLNRLLLAYHACRRRSCDMYLYELKLARAAGGNPPGTAR
jgi:glycosyltransferase involved in cell wall biosynthesis